MHAEIKSKDAIFFDGVNIENNEKFIAMAKIKSDSGIRSLFLKERSELGILILAFN